MHTGRPVSILLHPLKTLDSKGRMINTQQESADPLLSVSDLRLTFNTGYGGWLGNRRQVRAVDGISFDVQLGGVLGIVC